MALSDPQTISSLGGFTSLPRIGSSNGGGVFSSSDGTVQMSVNTSNGKRIRTAVRLSLSKISADVLVPSQNTRASTSVTLVMDRPVNGMTTAEVKSVVDTLTAWLAASTGANVTKVLGGEV